MKSYTHFTLSERECLQEKLLLGKSIRTIAKELGRNASSVSRELKRNRNKYPSSKTTTGYHPWRATICYIQRRKHCVRKRLIQTNTQMYSYIIDCLNLYWPPEAIAAKCNQRGYSISCSTIYRNIKLGLFKNIQPKTHLRRRGKNKNYVHHNSSAVQPIHTIHDRPDIVEKKIRLGDWEGDTVYGGIGKGCLITMVDRKSKILAAARCISRKKEDILNSIIKAFRSLNIQIPIETITLDNGSEFSGFEDIEKALNTTIYFTDPHSPWQRGLNENTNDIIRFFYPKGTNFLKITDEEVDLVVTLINNRPRKTLDYLSPLEFISSRCCT